MNLKHRTIHTTILRSDYQELLVLGKGKLNEGISSALELLREKELKIQVVTEVRIL